MTWWDLAVTVVVVAAVVLIPGGVLAAALGLRGLWGWALAAPFGVTVIALASLVAPLVGIGWSILPVAIVTAIIAVGIIVARTILRPGPDRTPRSAALWVVPLSLALAGAILLTQLLVVIQSPTTISQTFDNIFHLNALRYVLDGANASPLHVGGMTSDTGGVWFYPSAWHAIGALALQLTGVQIPVAAHGITLVLSCVFWPAGVVLLARTLFGSGAPLILSTGALAAAIPAFPLLLVYYGVLSPYALGMSLVPAVIAATLRALGVAKGGQRVTWVWALAVAGSLPALVIAHPGSFMTWLVFAALAVLIAFVTLLTGRPSRRVVITASVAFGAFVVAALVAWKVLKPPVLAREWPLDLTIGQAIGEAATQSQWKAAVPIFLVILLIIGIVASARRRSAADVWVLAAFLAVSVLYVASISFPWQTLRDLLTASWYNNAPRLAAMAPVVVVPLAAWGASATWRGAKRLVARSRERRGRSLPTRTFGAIAGALTLVVLVVVTQVGAMGTAVAQAQSAYTVAPTSPLLSTDEMALLTRLDGEVPPDAVIAASPWTGAGLAYALAGRRVLMPHTLMDIDADTQEINAELRDARPGTAVCDAIERKGVGYVLDFGVREVHDGRHDFPGLDRLRTSPAVELVDEEGQARLYRVVGCES